MSERLKAAWFGASARERSLVVLAGLVVAIGAVVALWQPLARDLAAGERALARMQATAMVARDEVDEIAGLAREARAPRTNDARAGAERVVDALGLRAALTALAGENGRVRLTFAAVESAALVSLLDGLAREELLFPVEALVAAHVTPGVVRAELSLARPAPR